MGVHPCKGSFHYLSFRHNFESWAIVVSHHNVYCITEGLFCIVHQFAPVTAIVLSCRLTLCTSATNSHPLVSVTMCRLQPFTFLFPSKLFIAAGRPLFTLWLSTIPTVALGDFSFFARASSRRWWSTSSIISSSLHLLY